MFCDMGEAGKMKKKVETDKLNLNHYPQKEMKWSQHENCAKAWISFLSTFAIDFVI